MVTITPDFIAVIIFPCVATAHLLDQQRRCSGTIQEQASIEASITVAESFLVLHLCLLTWMLFCHFIVQPWLYTRQICNPYWVTSAVFCYIADVACFPLRDLESAGTTFFRFYVGWTMFIGLSPAVISCFDGIIEFIDWISKVVNAIRPDSTRQPR